MAKFMVYAEKTAVKAYEVEADSEEEAIEKVREEELENNPITADDFISGVNIYI